MWRSASLLLVLLGASCYEPRLEPCTVRCASGSCPPGMSCSADGYCHDERPGATLCGDQDGQPAVVDGLNDGSTDAGWGDAGFDAFPPWQGCADPGPMATHFEVALDPALWSNLAQYGSDVRVEGSMLKLTPPPYTEGTPYSVAYAYVHSANTVAVDNRLYAVKVAQMVNTSEPYVEFYLGLVADDTHRVFIKQAGGVVVSRLVNGTSFMSDFQTYVPSEHVYLGLRLRGTQADFVVSPDGDNWAALKSVSVPWLTSNPAVLSIGAGTFHDDAGVTVTRDPGSAWVDLVRDCPVAP